MMDKRLKLNEWQKKSRSKTVEERQMAGIVQAKEFDDNAMFSSAC